MFQMERPHQKHLLVVSSLFHRCKKIARKAATPKFLNHIRIEPHFNSFLRKRSLCINIVRLLPSTNLPIILLLNNLRLDDNKFSKTTTQLSIANVKRYMMCLKNYIVPAVHCYTEALPV